MAKVLESDIIRVLHQSGKLSAKQIAQKIDADKSDVNRVLYAGLDRIFSPDDETGSWKALTSPVQVSDSLPATIRCYFSPDQQPISHLIHEVRKAGRRRILIQAFFLDHKELGEALIEQLERRPNPVKVDILVGKTSRSKARKPNLRHGGAAIDILVKLHDAGASIYEYREKDHNHNKCIVLDDDLTVTGGLNFGHYSEKNADNLVIIQSPAVAKLFTENFHCNRRLSSTRKFSPNGR